MSDEGTLKASKKSRATGFIRIGVSIIALIILVKVFDAGELLSRITSVSLWLWLSVFAGFLLGHAVAAAKWRLIIGSNAPYFQVFKAHFAGLAANLALPGVAGGDVVRAAIIMKGSNRKTALALGSLADRLIDTSVLIIIAASGALWLGVRSGVNPMGLALAGIVVIIGGIASIILLHPIASLMRNKAPSGKIGAIISDVANTLDELAKRRGALFLCIAMSIAIQLSFAIMNGIVASNISAGTSIAAWIFAWPLAKLIATLPISFGGLGVREASIAGLMAPMGFDASGVIAASLIWQSVLYAGGLTGVIVQSFAVRQLGGNAKANHG